MIVNGASVSPKIMDDMKLTLSQYLKMACKNFGHKIAMMEAETGKCFTYREMFERSFKIAAFLNKIGCSENSVIGTACENQVDFLCLLLAVWHIGAICNCVHPRLSEDELQHAFQISQPRVVFASSLSFDKVQNIRQICTSIQRIINIDTEDCTLQSATELELNTIKTKIEKIEPTDIATILYSSGTTGLSKGVKLSHKSYIHLMEIYRTEKFMQFPKNNVISGLLPMSHAYGLFVMISSLTLGHTYVLMKRYTGESFLNYVQKYRINTLYIVPAIISFIAKNSIVFDYDLSCVKYISTGGSSIRKEIMEKLKQRLPNAKIFQHYGMTESTTMCLVSQANSKPDSTGKLVPGMMAKVVDIDTGAILGPNKSGELCIKGPLLMNGYCQNKDNVIQGIDEDGWLHTGDVAYFDEDLDFYIIDRIKELIKYKSFQVPPQEIELLLMQHDAVEEVGVVGVPDEETGELPRAYIVKKNGFENVTETDLQQYVAKNISPPKRLRGGVIFVNELPKTALGKISRKDLKKWVQRDI